MRKLKTISEQVYDYIIEKLTNGEKVTIQELMRKMKKEGVERFVITKPEYIYIILNLIEKLQKENNRLKVIKYDIDYGTETVNLIPKSTLVEINTNRYMIEIEDGKFIDLKQVYQENKTLKELHIQDNKHLDFIMKNSIPIQKLKDKIEELEQEKKKYGNCLIEIYENELINRDIQVLQELIEEEEEKHEENI